MKRIIFTAQAFGFGPVSKTISIAGKLKHCRNIFFGSGVAFDLAKLHFDEVYKLGYEDSQEIESLLAQSDLLINVMDFRINFLAKEARCPVFSVDSLLWFWPELPDGIAESDSYFCQNFFGNKVLSKVREYGLSNAQIIGPIVYDNLHKPKRISQIIVNFGGCEGKIEDSVIEVGKNTNYPFVILKNLLPILAQEFTDVLVTGLGKVMKACQSQFLEYGNVKFMTLHPYKMLEECSRSEAMFTVAGIQSLFDAGTKLPLFCLPPNNHSHAYNLDIFLENKVVKHCFHWNECYDFDLNKCHNRKEKIEVVLKTIENFSNNGQNQQFFRSKVAEFLKKKENWDELLLSQKKILKGLGTNGADTIANAVTKFLYAEELAVGFSYGH